MSETVNEAARGAVPGAPLHSYQVHYYAHAGNVLQIDESESACPFTPPVVMQAAPKSKLQLDVAHQQPQLNVQRFPCSTKCPLAQLVEEKGDLYYITNCGTREIRRKVMPKPLEENEPGSDQQPAAGKPNVFLKTV